MARYVILRLGWGVFTLLIVSVLVFMLMHIAAGDPARTLGGEFATEKEISSLRHEMGLDKPLIEQFVGWIKDCVTGKTISMHTRIPCFQLIYQRLPVTLSLTGVSLIVAVVIGLPLGVTAAFRQGTWIDRVSISLSTLGVAIPSFWLAMNLILLFAVKLRLLPSGGYVAFGDSPALWLKSLVLPSFTLGFIQAAFLARITRSSMLDVMGQDYVRTAYAKGLRTELVNRKHILRNALIPIVTVIGLIIGILLGGAVVIEQVYTLPGIGRLLVQAVGVRDYPLIQATVLLIAVGYITINLIVDLSYAFLDPRIVYGA